MEVLKTHSVEWDKIDIQLSKYEAKVLHRILRRIGGDPQETPRGITDNLKELLEKHGIDSEEIEPVKGNIHFT